MAPLGGHQCAPPCEGEGGQPPPPPPLPLAPGPAWPPTSRRAVAARKQANPGVSSSRRGRVFREHRQVFRLCLPAWCVPEQGPAPGAALRLPTPRTAPLPPPPSPCPQLLPSEQDRPGTRRDVALCLPSRSDNAFTRQHTPPLPAQRTASLGVDVWDGLLRLGEKLLQPGAVLHPASLARVCLQQELFYILQAHGLGA